MTSHFKLDSILVRIIIALKDLRLVALIGL